MKQVVSFVFALLLFASSLSAQFRSIPSSVTGAFGEKYPAATNVSWEDKVTSFQAKFVMDNESYEARFDKEGNWKETEKSIEFETLPEAIKSTFRSSEYKDWTIVSVAELEKPEDVKEFRIYVKSNLVKRKNLYYNEEGKFLRDETTL